MFLGKAHICLILCKIIEIYDHLHNSVFHDPTMPSVSPQHPGLFSRTLTQ